MSKTMVIIIAFILFDISAFDICLSSFLFKLMTFPSLDYALNKNHLENVDLCARACVCACVFAVNKFQLDLEYKPSPAFCVQWFQCQVQFSNPLLCFLVLYYTCTTLRFMWWLVRCLCNSSGLKACAVFLWVSCTHKQLKIWHTCETRSWVVMHTDLESPLL